MTYRSYQDEVEIAKLVGNTFVKVERAEDDSYLRFYLDNGDFYEFSHTQDCCESVYIESITGDLQDLVGTPIVQAVESISEKPPEGFGHEYEPESQTWTFYKFATIKGYVDVRWFGESNGYYSKDVDLYFIKKGAVQ